MSRARSNVWKLRPIFNALDPYFGAKGDGVTDDSSALQAIIDEAAGAPIYCPAGTYCVETGLTYVTSAEGPGLNLFGDGIGKTKFDNKVANGPMLYLDGGVTSIQPLGALLEGFSIIDTTGPAASIGIQMRGQWMATLRRLVVDGMSSDGVKIINNVSDPDASAYIEIDQAILRNNGGWGINIPDPATSSVAIAACSISRSHIVSNTAGGARLLGQIIEAMLTAFAFNGGVGMLLPYSATAAASQMLQVRGCEFDGNVGRHLDVLNAANGLIELSKFIYGATGLTGIRLGDGGSGQVNHFACERNHHRRDAGTHTVHSIGSNAFYSKVKNNHYPTTAGLTIISDAGTATEVEQDGQVVKDAMDTVSTTGSGSYTPDMSVAKYHRVVINATGAFTIVDPVRVAAGADETTDGRELLLAIVNVSGGAITVSFDTGYKVGGYTDPADGKWRTARFIYHAVAGQWIQIGDWSTDL